MKLLTKLSTLIKAAARGPTQQRPREPRVPTPDSLPDVEAAQATSIVEQEQPLEGGRVADLIQRKLSSSGPASQQGEKGD
jgi:hypothetical protein